MLVLAIFTMAQLVKNKHLKPHMVHMLMRDQPVFSKRLNVALVGGWCCAVHPFLFIRPTASPLTAAVALLSSRFNAAALMEERLTSYEYAYSTVGDTQIEFVLEGHCGDYFPACFKTIYLQHRRHARRTWSVICPGCVHVMHPPIENTERHAHTHKSCI